MDGTVVVYQLQQLQRLLQLQPLARTTATECQITRRRAMSPAISLETAHYSKTKKMVSSSRIALGA